MELEDYFKTPSQEEIDRQWLTQLCYDGQMADDEIEEHVNAIIEWNEKRVKNNVDLYNVSGSFSAKDMENFAAKCMILGNSGKTTKELLKDFCDNDR